ncbi:MAG TPA: hypothetical protein VGQ19_05545 [Burkholderiales bacterium]|jgi:hypothetical protein|nr:hypothetical protein [Burkholderiales bacterium]
MIADHMLERVSAFAAARPHNMRVADVLRTLQADRIGMTIICSAGISRLRALSLFDKLARAESGTSYLNTHAEPLERKASLAEWTRAQNLVCLD